ncbi:MAG: alpha/beta hydrolase [Actinomycetota bacterium]|nr:alpha/beta hydrolase [Actinomycetota bacterium]
MGATMERAPVNGVELEFDSAGSGEAVVFIHGMGFADTYLPLAFEPPLQDRYHVIRYRRRGYAGSTPVDGPVPVAEHAQDCRALLGALEVKQAHVVGHSYGTCVALQLAVDAPGIVDSLALFDPPLLTAPSAPQWLEAVGPSVEKYMAGDRIGAIDDLFSAAGGPDWRSEMNRAVPGAAGQVEKDAATLVESDIPSAQEWRFGAEEAAKIKQPVLLLSGAENHPMFIESRELLGSWLPCTESYVMPGANHLSYLFHPADTAARLADFLKRDAIAA